MKEVVRGRIVPILEFLAKAHVGQVAEDAGHRDAAAPPRRAKVKVKVIVLGILCALHTPLQTGNQPGDPPLLPELILPC